MGWLTYRTRLGSAWLVRKVSFLVISCSLFLTVGMGPPPWAAEQGNTAEQTEDGQEILRLTSRQYRQIIEDTFGPMIDVSGTFEPDLRKDGLFAIGAAHVSVTNTGFEQYEAIARNIAQQVTNEENRSTLVPCVPASAKRFDTRCAEMFIAASGRLLWRRPLTKPELERKLLTAREFADHYHDFYAGIAAALVDLLDSPNFLFRINVVEQDPSHPGRERLDAYSKASKLSFLLWNSGPDDALLRAAEDGSIHDDRELERQVTRMLPSSKLENGVRAFFTDMLELSRFDELIKDAELYPKFTLGVRQDAAEQTLRTITDLLLKRKGDYRDIFVTRKTFLTRSLAILYGVILVDPETENGTGARWIPHEYAAGDPRSGILSQATFTAMHSHPGRSSPTLRGKAMRELLLCQEVPPPPGDVDFTLVTSIDPRYRTARERLNAHNSNPVCAGCHKLTDPIGFTFENFDGAGSFRQTERGAQIDPSGKFGGAAYSTPAEFKNLARESAAATSCVAKKVFAFGAGHLPSPSPAWTQIEGAFASSGYRFHDLLRLISTSELFYQAGTNEAPQQTATTTDTRR